MSKVLICPLCDSKLYTLKKDLKDGDVVLAEYLEPYSEKVIKPIDFEQAKCSFCGHELIFEDKYIIKE